MKSRLRKLTFQLINNVEINVYKKLTRILQFALISYNNVAFAHLH